MLKASNKTRKFLVSIPMLVIASGCLDSSSDSSTASQEGGTSDGGTTSRFAIQNGYFYVATENELIPFNLSLPDLPQKMTASSKPAITGAMETIVRYQEDLLFIGTTGGVEIYRTFSDGSAELESTVTHFTGCDPVLPYEDVAFNTVRGGTNCGFRPGNLRVLDISEIEQADVLFEYEIENPKGMGVSHRNLFLCRGQQYPLMQMKIEADYQLTKLRDYPEIYCNDVIVKNDYMYISGDSRTVISKINVTQDEMDEDVIALETKSIISIGDLGPKLGKVDIDFYY